MTQILVQLKPCTAGAGKLTISNSSSIDNVPSDLETSIRCAGAQLTQAAGILLHLSILLWLVDQKANLEFLELFLP
jgi:hypothetical protein